MAADAGARSVDEKSGIGLESHAGRMVCNGTGVPAPPSAGAVDPASATTTGNAQRASVEIVIDISSISRSREVNRPRATRRYALHTLPQCDLRHSGGG